MLKENNDKDLYENPKQNLISKDDKFENPRSPVRHDELFENPKKPIPKGDKFENPKENGENEKSPER